MKKELEAFRLIQDDMETSEGAIFLLAFPEISGPTGAVNLRTIEFTLLTLDSKLKFRLVFSPLTAKKKKNPNAKASGFFKRR